MKTMAILAAILVSGAAALAQEPAASPATKRAGPNGNPDQIVCVNHSEIGSRLRTRRVCRTRAEWAAHQRDTRDQIDKAQQQTQSQNNN
jgi:hypothetical protein